MRKKYADCRRADGDCTICPLVNYGRDCHNRPITKLEWSRRMAGMTQAELVSTIYSEMAEFGFLRYNEGSTWRTAKEVSHAAHFSGD